METLDVSWDASTVTLQAGKSYDALCIPRTLPDKAYYPGGEVRVTDSSVLGITKVIRKYTSRKGQTGDLYTVQALKVGESRLIANVTGKTSSVLVKVV